MIFLRSVLFGLYLVVLTIPYALFSVLTFPFPVETRYRLVAYQWARCVIWGAEKICGIRYQVQGWDNIAHHGVIFVAKHQSRWETIALPSMIPLVTRQIADETIIVPIRGGVGELNAIFTLNPIGTMIWEMLKVKTADSTIVQRICQEYQVEPEKAKADLDEFLDSLRNAGLICSSPQSGG